MSLSSTTALILLPTVVNGLLTSTGQRGRSTWFREDEAGSCLRVQLLGHLRAFCRWMVEQDWLVSDPSKRIPNPRKPQQLPKAILDETEVASILAQPDLRTATGYRDRVILEVLYSSAIRREEAPQLLLDDVDTTHGFLIVREGKNRKDRAVPTGGGVCELLQTYVAGVRAE